MNDKKRKVIKRILGTLVILLAAHPLWLGFAAKTAANIVAPMVVKTDFRIDSLYVNIYTLDVSLSGLMVGNPEPWKASEPRAAGIAAVHVDLAWGGLFSKHLHVQDLTVSDVFASYLGGDDGSNVDVLLANVMGQPKPEESAPEEKPVETEETSSDPIKIRVDHLKINGVTVQFALMPIKVPIAIELDDIGATSDGVTLPEFGNIVASAVLNAAGNAGAAVGSLLGSAGGAAGETLGDAGNKAGDAIGNAIDAIANTEFTKDGLKATGDTLKATGKQFKSIGKDLKKMFK